MTNKVIKIENLYVDNPGNLGQIPSYTDSIVHKDLKIYSKGMLQRLKYALANLLPWSILFFDEPFSGLDIEGKSLALDCLNAWKANDRTMIFVTHDVEWGLSFCNRLFLLEEGNLIIDQSAGSLDVKTIMSGLK